MWSKLFGVRHELPSAKVEAVVRVVDRYLSEEAKLRRLQSEKQTIHLRDLPLQKRQALVEEVFAIIGERRKEQLARRSAMVHLGAVGSTLEPSLGGGRQGFRRRGAGRPSCAAWWHF
jgi:hypothetical protein